jgi:hypothetical protein
MHKINDLKYYVLTLVFLCLSGAAFAQNETPVRLDPPVETTPAPAAPVLPPFPPQNPPLPPTRDRAEAEQNRIELEARRQQEALAEQQAQEAEAGTPEENTQAETAEPALNIEQSIESILSGDPANLNTTETPSTEARPATEPATVENQTEPALDPVQVNFTARLSMDSPTLGSDVVWHVFKADGNEIDESKIMVEQVGGVINANLEPGAYIITADYGTVQATRTVAIGNQPQTVDIVFNAGGMRLRAALSEDNMLSAENITFTIDADDPTNPGSRITLLENAPHDKIIALAEGTYYVTSSYGNLNSVVRADIRVQPGKLTNATLYHRAARITLKLVNEPGGEALANTSWTVLNPNGDSLSEIVGAFPSLILAEGNYTAIARHEGSIYNRDFSVESGLNRDVELVAE